MGVMLLHGATHMRPLYHCATVCMCVSVCVCRLVYPLDSGIMCLDIHEEQPALVAVGLYDGRRVCLNVGEYTRTYVCSNSTVASVGVNGYIGECTIASFTVSMLQLCVHTYVCIHVALVSSSLPFPWQKQEHQ